ncbi:MAG: hypothetical protein IJU92_08070 [Spirochaetaceae bacterium]|nr:hypothetical protein [Spirochaetaceae bacterium]
MDKDILDLLLRLRDEDETQWLNLEKESLEHLFDNSPQRVRDLLLDFFDKLADKIEEYRKEKLD